MVAEPTSILYIGENDNAQFHLAAAYLGLCVTQRHVMKIEVHIRIVGAKARKQRRQEIAKHGVAGGDADAAGQIVAAKARLAQCVAQRVEHITRLRR